MSSEDHSTRKKGGLTESVRSKIRNSLCGSISAAVSNPKRPQESKGADLDLQSNGGVPVCVCTKKMRRHRREKKKLKSRDNKVPLKVPYVVDPAWPDITKMNPATPPPRNLKEVSKSLYWPHYRAAMGVEKGQLVIMGSGEQVTRVSVPTGHKVLRGRWDFDHKKDRG